MTKWHFKGIFTFSIPAKVLQNMLIFLKNVSLFRNIIKKNLFVWEKQAKRDRGILKKIVYTENKSRG